VIQNHPHRAGSHLRRELVRCLACHGSTLSRVGASGKPGAVHPANHAKTIDRFHVVKHAAELLAYAERVADATPEHEKRKQTDVVSGAARSDKNAYQAALMRKRRAAAKAEKQA
jgi:hypothetical protein